MTSRSDGADGFADVFNIQVSSLSEYLFLKNNTSELHTAFCTAAYISLNVQEKTRIFDFEHCNKKLKRIKKTGMTTNVAP
jgi:hypothetical protein